MNLDLSGKRALVCGSTQGIGRACAHELASLGASVVLMARDATRLASLAKDLPARAGQTHAWLAADFTSPPAVAAAAQSAVRDAPIHVLINNTGGPPAGLAIDATPDDFEHAFRTHLVCFQHLVRAVTPGMKDANYGRIVNIISTSVITPIAGLGVSNTIRGAVANWGRTLAHELAPFGITVNNVLPGFTDTERLRSLLQRKARTAGLSEDEVTRQAIASVPMKRFASPHELAAVVAFLASPAASYVSGVNLPVDGARLAAQ